MDLNLTIPAQSVPLILASLGRLRDDLDALSRNLAQQANQQLEAAKADQQTQA